MFKDSRVGRRAAALLMGLIVTGLLVGAAFVRVPPRYEVTASVLMLPGEGNIPRDANPFLFLGGLSQVGDVLRKIMNSDDSREALIRGREGIDYRVELDPTASAPILLVTSTGPEPSSALTLRDSVVSLLPVELKRLQDEAAVPLASRILPVVLISEPVATRLAKQQVRAVVAAGGIGVGLTVAAVAGVDLLARRHHGSGAHVDRRGHATIEGGPDPVAGTDTPSGAPLAGTPKPTGEIPPVDTMREDRGDQSADEPEQFHSGRRLARS